MNIAIIPARGGSKRIPGKNIKLFHGKPIIAYAIETALASGLFSRVVVSTDSKEIAQVAQEYGAEVPFLRPKDIADDFATTASVLSHGLGWFRSQGDEIEALCCIYPTAVFLRQEYLQKGHELLNSCTASSVFSVAEFPSSPFRAFLAGGDGSLRMAYPEHELSRTNDLPEMYFDAGQFYWLNAEKFAVNPQLYTSDARPVTIPSYLVQDIDTLDDWIYAELIFEIIEKKRKE